MSETDKVGGSPPVYRVPAAHRSLNHRGNGPEWFRQVFRDGRWQWITSERLPRDTSDRRATVYGRVLEGEIVVGFGRYLPERRCTVEGFWVVTSDPTVAEHLVRVGYAPEGLDSYRLTLPDGTTVTVADPLKRSQT